VSTPNPPRHHRSSTPIATVALTAIEATIAARCAGNTV